MRSAVKAYIEALVDCKSFAKFANHEGTSLFLFSATTWLPSVGVEPDDVAASLPAFISDLQTTLNAR